MKISGNCFTFASAMNNLELEMIFKDQFDQFETIPNSEDAMTSIRPLAKLSNEQNGLRSLS